MRNKYIRRSHLSEARFRALIRLFALDLEATKIAALSGISRTTVNRYLQLIRTRIAQRCEAASPFAGEVEVDESYFGPRRVRGKRGRGAAGKTIVFGVLQRGGNVYTEIVPDCSKRTLQRIIRGQVDPASVVHSDTWRGYDGLVDLGYKKHFRIRHGRDEFALGRTHINGIESFWSFAKGRLLKFQGIPKSTFYLHLKETEFRFNNRSENLYLLLLHWFRTKPL